MIPEIVYLPVNASIPPPLMRQIGGKASLPVTGSAMPSVL